jgi:hypothetical protein
MLPVSDLVGEETHGATSQPGGFVRTRSRGLVQQLLWVGGYTTVLCTALVIMRFGEIDGGEASGAEMDQDQTRPTNQGKDGNTPTVNVNREVGNFQDKVFFLNN